MASFLLASLFSIAACIESAAYGVYELKINKNKPAGIVLIVLSIVGIIFPIGMYLTA